MKSLILKNKKLFKLEYKEPFSFEKTFYNPSRYESGLEYYNGNDFYMSLSFLDLVFGLKFYMNTDSQLIMELYSENKLSNRTTSAVVKEITFRFSLNMDYKSFHDNYSKDKFLSEVIKRNYGKHISSLYSLYENLIISVLLQNTTIKRTVDMTKNLLEAYGKRIEYDSQKLYALWTPKELNATDSDLRVLKVGYRAKNILRITDYFKSAPDCLDYRELNENELEKELLKIYGVGKQTVFYSMLGTFHITGYLKHIPLWERKILSKYIFNEELCEEKYIVDWFHSTYANWCGYALSMIIEDVFFIHKSNPIPWMKKILKED